jgi:hypothetical protein
MDLAYPIFAMIKVALIFRPTEIVDLWPLVIGTLTQYTVSFLVGYVYMKLYMPRLKYKMTILGMLISTNSVVIPILVVVDA